MESRSKTEGSNLPSGQSGVGNILLDIEGTTTSIKFVTDVLFPYARQHVSKWLEQHWLEPEIQEIVRLLRAQCSEDEENGMSGLQKIIDGNDKAEVVRESVVKNVLWQMDEDRKSSGLKALQGKIWKDGFVGGELKGHVYEDVAEAFKRWKESGRNIHIYSSGSIEAQKLLFGYSIAGDLSTDISGYFDTTTGPKREAKSYKLIAEQINNLPHSFIFLTDIPEEAYAAKDAGMHVCLLVRPGNKPITEDQKKELNFANDFNLL